MQVVREEEHPQRLGGCVGGVGAPCPHAAHTCTVNWAFVVLLSAKPCSTRCFTLVALSE